jgi:hypothetical protein
MGEKTLDHLLPRPYQWRWALVVAVLLLALYVSLRLLVVPWVSSSPRPPGNAVLGGILDTMLGSAAFGGVAWVAAAWLIPPRSRSVEIEPVPSNRLHRELEHACRDATEWRFKGGVGRWVRASAIPKMASLAKESQTTRTVWLELIDPDNQDACARYANFRHTNAPQGPTGIDISVALDVMTTIASALLHAETEPRLVVKIALAGHVTLSRYDIGPDAAFVTTDDRRDPGLRADKGGGFYERFREETINSWDQSKMLVTTEMTVSWKQIDAAGLRTNFDKLGIATKLSDADAQRIIQQMGNPVDPYS